MLSKDMLAAYHALIGNRNNMIAGKLHSRKWSYSVTANAWRLMERRTSSRWIFDVSVWPCITSGISKGPSHTSTRDNI